MGGTEEHVIREDDGRLRRRMKKRRDESGMRKGNLLHHI